MRRQTSLRRLLDENVTANEQMTRCTRKVLYAPLMRLCELANGDTGAGGAACPFIEDTEKIGLKSGNLL
jgi:hypothetical protein